MKEYFKVKEFVSEEVYNLLGDKAILLFDPVIIEAVIKIRKFYDRPITINNWAWGGVFQNRGFRTYNCVVGAAKSAHKDGKALDFDVKGMTAAEVREDIREHWKEWGITEIEEGVNWVHISCRETGLDELKIFYP